MHRLRHKGTALLGVLLAAAVGGLVPGGSVAAAVPAPEPVAIGQSTDGDLQVLAADSDAVGSQVKIRTYTVGMPASVKAQRWTFEVVSPGATPIYRIRHASSGRCLQAVSASDGSDVILVDCGTAAQQFWTVVRPQTWPTYGSALRNQRDGRCLDLWYSEDGQPATMWGCDSVYETQLWRTRVGGFNCPDRAEVGLCVQEDAPVSGVMVNFRQQPVSFTGPPPGSPSNPGYNNFSNQVNWNPVDSSGGDSGYDYEEMGWRASYTALTGSTAHTAYWLEGSETAEVYWPISRPDSTLADGSVHTWMSMGTSAGQWDVFYDFNLVGTTQHATGSRTRQLQTGLFAGYAEYAALATPFENRMQVFGNGTWRRTRLVNVAAFPANICGQPDPRSILAGEPNTPPYCFTTQLTPRVSNLPSSPTEVDRIQLGKPATGALALRPVTPQPVTPQATTASVNGVDQRQLAACMAEDPGRCLDTVPGLAACVQARKVCNVNTRSTLGTKPAPITADTARQRVQTDVHGATRPVSSTMTAADFGRRTGVTLTVDGGAEIHVVTGDGAVTGFSRRAATNLRGYTAVYAAATGDLLYACLGTTCSRKGLS